MRTRINFGVSEFLRDWVRTQPNVQAIAEESVNHITIEHTMSGAQLQTFKNNFIDKLAESV